MSTTSPAAAVLDRLIAATNAHDLDALVGCFADDYALESPAAPAMSFIGSEQVRINWSRIFAAAPDIWLEVQNRTADDGRFWVELAQHGTAPDGRALHSQMIFIADVAAGQISRARIYVIPVDRTRRDVDQMVGDTFHPETRPTP